MVLTWVVYLTNLGMQEYKLCISGRAALDSNTFTGEVSFDIAEYAFKGKTQQSIRLSIPLKPSKTWAGTELDKEATAEISIFSLVVRHLICP